MTAFTVMNWNVQNLFLPDHEDGPDDLVTFQYKLASLDALIDQERPHVLALQEVGSDDALAQRTGLGPRRDRCDFPGLVSLRVFENLHNKEENMPKRASLENSLIEVGDCCLVLIDVQQGFLDKLSKKGSKRLAKRLLWLVKVAVKLEVPVVVTAEDIEGNGSVIPKLLKFLPPGIQVHNKMVFDLAADSGIMRAVKATGRGTAVLAGLETDVCVAHSAIGLLGTGYKVVVVEDACAAPGKAHRYGLARMRGAGALISNLKSLYYEWLRTVEGSRAFYEEFKDELGDPGVRL